MRLILVVVSVTGLNLMLHSCITDQIAADAKREVIDAQENMLKKWKDKQDEEEGKFNI
jgi:hypothetical protein